MAGRFDRRLPVTAAAGLLLVAAGCVAALGFAWADRAADDVSVRLAADEVSARATAADEASRRLGEWMRLSREGRLAALPIVIEEVAAQYLPEAAPRDLESFSAAERAEFVDHDSAAALAAYEGLAEDGATGLRARAWRSVARLRFAAGEERAGLDALDEAWADPDAGDADRLLARYDRFQRTSTDAESLRVDLERGEFAGVPPGERLFLYEQLGGARARVAGLEALAAYLGGASADRAVRLAGDRLAWPTAGTGVAGESRFVVVERSFAVAALVDGAAEDRFVSVEAGGDETTPLRAPFPPLALADGPATVAQRASERERAFRSRAVLPGAATLVLLVAAVLLLVDARRRARLEEREAGFVAAVTHELKTPIASIRLFAETLRDRDDVDPARRTRFLSIIVAEADRLTARIQQVLDVAAGRDGTVGASERFDVVAAVREVGAEMASTFEAAGCEVRVAAPGAPVEVVASRALFTKAVGGLLDNAAKFGRRRPIDVAVEVDGRTVRVDVQDGGPGVAAVERERVFEPFVRLEDEMTRAVDGTGLGLTLVRQCIEACGGRALVVPSEGGARFRLEVEAA